MMMSIEETREYMRKMEESGRTRNTNPAHHNKIITHHNERGCQKHRSLFFLSILCEIRTVTAVKKEYDRSQTIGSTS